ncbi:hypothetical protein Pse7367_2701 [Thalassoporum mexicanum PCC 7367]|uniref:hypothetical protein n=1 Tax=Thalassoporum mexicanum TaxID=3457544 RepID=UPI00029F9B85|nr:hypothetical protein [Pseudanabaena sp. PCC 7367]AFY70956.1 hypothetical protein Pse7367_2701 [Pseudanabaena sp. PCC 7367]
MKPVHRWKKNIYQTIEEIASKEYQEKAWLGKLEGVMSSPDELMLNLLEDFYFDEFLDSEEIGLNDQQKQAGKYLLKKVDEYYDNSPIFPIPEEVLSDPGWHEIRNMAKNVLHICQVQGHYFSISDYVAHKKDIS